MTDGETVAELITDYDAQCAMSREIAAGHADILREQIDGVTGSEI